MHILLRALRLFLKEGLLRIYPLHIYGVTSGPISTPVRAHSQAIPA